MASDSQDAKERMRSQQVALVFEQTRANQLISPVIAALVATALWPVGDRYLLAGWVGLLAVMSVGRQLLAVAYRRCPPENLDSRLWERRFVVSLSIVSAVWGIGGWLIMPAGAELHQMLVFTILLGMAAGTSSIYGAHSTAVALAIALILGPATIYMATKGDLFHIILTVTIFVYVVTAARGLRWNSKALQRNIELAGELDRLARVDMLSGLANRRAFTEFGESALSSAGRRGHACVLIMIDVDFFKGINDRVGHAGGDAVIRALGALLGKSVRAGECAGRIGGEEFAILLPESSGEEGLAVAERLLAKIRATPVALEHESLSVTVSIGVAVSGEGACPLDKLMDSADAALYAAKQGGRNRVVLAATATKAEADS